MEVIHLSISDGGGGAARSAYRLHQGLLRLGCASKMLVATKVTGDPTVQRFEVTSRWWHRYVRLPQRILRRLEGRLYRHTGFEIFTDDRPLFGCGLRLPAASVVNLHWVAGILHPGKLRRRGREGPRLVWTLHDMHPFTGGCHFDNGCGRFVYSCGRCPQLSSQWSCDLSRRSWRRKRRAYGGRTDLQVVAPSHWLAGEFGRSSIGAGVSCRVIPYGVDVELFCPGARRPAREALGLPVEGSVVLLVAHDLSVPRKGGQLIPRLVRGLYTSGVVGTVVTVGRAGDREGREGGVYDLGTVNDDHMMATIYRAADLMLVPSLQDNLPNTAVEALACGTPVVAFEVGGIPEVVRPGVSGALVRPGDVDHMVAAVVELLHAGERRQEMSAQCRTLAVSRFDLALQAARYWDLYRSLLSSPTEEGVP